MMTNTDSNKGIKYLAKNVGLISIGTFSTSLLSFFLVPLYTSVLSTTDYGNYDLINTTVALLMPFLTLSIEEPVMRFTLDNGNKDIKDVFTVGIKHVVIGILLAGAFAAINHFLGIFQVIDDFWSLFILMYSFTSICNVLTFFARGLERVSDVAISGALGTLVSIICNIVFLLPLHMGLLGYFLANIAGTATQSLFVFFRVQCWKYFGSLRNINREQEKRMIRYSTPMIANTVSWWVNNASDRYIVTWLSGVSVNGLYSVAYKIPSILNVFQRIFLQAWTISAVKDYDPEDKNGFFSNLYNSFNFLMVFSCSALIMLDKPIAHILYAKDFYGAWVYVPFLMISIVFSALNGYMGGIFSAVNNSKLYAISTAIGAVVNTVLNIVLVYSVGALGAAIATAVGYWVVWVVRRRYMLKYIHIKMRLVRDYISYVLLVIQAIILINLTGNNPALYTIQFGMIVLIIILYTKELVFVKNKVFAILSRKSRSAEI